MSTDEPETKPGLMLGTAHTEEKSNIPIPDFSFSAKDKEVEETIMIPNFEKMNRGHKLRILRQIKKGIRNKDGTLKDDKQG